MSQAPAPLSPPRADAGPPPDSMTNSTSGLPPHGSGAGNPVGEPAETPVPFVSRSAPGPEPDGSGLEDPFGTWSNPALLAIGGLTMLLQAISWWILDGYQIADSVEYLEHAQAFARDQEVVDSHVIRSYGFIALLTPLFLLADWVGLEDLKPLVWVARGMQMAFGLLLVQACARIATRLAGKRCGLVAAFLVATNPVFLQYSVSPIADVAAALFVGLGIEQALRPRGSRSGLATGLWFGAAMMAAYKTLLVTGPVVAFLLLRELARRDLRRVRYISSIAAGLLLAVGAQVGLDKAVYGKWGISLANYVIVNTSPIVPFVLRDIGRPDLAKKAYDMVEEAARQEGDLNVDPGDLSAKPNRMMGVHWYLQELPSMLVWPVIAGALLGLLLCAFRPSWSSSLLLFVFLANYAVMSQKGSKDFRLWLPLLPCIAPLCAWGLDSLWRRAPGPKLLKLAGAMAVLGATLALGMHTLLDRNTRKFSGYWDAMLIIDEEAALERGPDDPKVSVAAAYHWAVYLRESENVHLEKLPHHLSRWATYTDEQRGAAVAAILQKDWFITHLPVLTNELHVELLRSVNEAFEVHSLLWDHEDFEDIGPVLVLRRRWANDPRPPLGRRLYREVEISDPAQYRKQYLLPPPTRFLRDFPGLGKREEVWLLGWEYENLPGDGHGWITYHWY